jgi:hypothetical protein
MVYGLANDGLHLNKPLTANEGDGLVALVWTEMQSNDGSPYTAPPAPSGIAGWTLIASEVHPVPIVGNDYTTFWAVYAYYKTATNSEPSTYTFTDTYDRGPQSDGSGYSSSHQYMGYGGIVYSFSYPNVAGSPSTWAAHAYAVGALSDSAVFGSVPAVSATVGDFILHLCITTLYVASRVYNGNDGIEIGGSQFSIQTEPVVAMADLKATDGVSDNPNFPDYAEATSDSHMGYLYYNSNSVLEADLNLWNYGARYGPVGVGPLMYSTIMLWATNAKTTGQAEGKAVTNNYYYNGTYGWSFQDTYAFSLRVKRSPVT